MKSKVRGRALRLGSALIAIPLGVVVLLGAVSLSAASSGGLPSVLIVFHTEHVCSTGRIGDCGRGEIAVMNSNGSGFRQLTHNKVTESAPAWSPDHRWIAYVRGGSPRVWVMDANGRHQRRLTRLPQTQGSPAWSPDGRKVVFTTSDLYIVDVRTGRPTRLTAGQEAGSPAWSPDGRKIAFNTNHNQKRGQVYQIYVVSVLRHVVVQLTYCHGEGCVGPAWSPDGRRIAFLNLDGGIYVMNANGTHVRKLHRGPLGRIGSPRWSPDGRWLAFEQESDVFVMRRDSSGLHRVTHARPGWVNVEPDW